MKSTLCWISILMVLWLSPPGYSGERHIETVTLVRAGEPVSAIRLSPDATRACFQAGAELVCYVQRISGVELPVFVDSDDHVRPRAVRIRRARPTERKDAHRLDAGDFLPIRIGTAVSPNHDDRIRAEGGPSDAFALIVSDEGIDILGLQPVGAQHAVFELLRQLGVRWFDPLEDGLVIPEKSTVTIAYQDTVQTPRDELRMMPPVTPREILYTLRMKREHLAQIRQSRYVSSTPAGDEHFVVGRTSGWDGNPETYWTAVHVPPVTDPDGDPAMTPVIPTQPIHAYRITDPETDGLKTTIVLTDGNQSEYPASWAFHATIDFLIGDDPRAAELRRRAVFYVYPLLNPDGRFIMSREQNPELLAAGWHNHKRVWDSVGLFSTVDTLTAAIRYDTGGQTDYFIDFHAGMTRSVTTEHLLDSPLVRAMKSRTHFDVAAMTIRGAIQEWAARTDGLDATYVYTTYMEDWDDLARCFEVGQAYGLSLHDVVTGRISAEEDVHADARQIAPRRRWLKRRHLPSSLIEAAEYSDAERMEILLKSEPDVNVRNQAGMTPLHLVAEDGFVEMSRMLIARGANVNLKNHRGWTPLHYAARHDSRQVAALLIEHGAEVNARHVDGDTPLHLAAAYNRADIVELLRNAGAEPGVKGRWNRTPLDWATRLGYDAVSALLKGGQQ